MYRTARYITKTIAIILMAITAASCEVKDVFAPKTEFYGGEGNATQWQLICPDPANVSKSYTLNPNQVFSSSLKGSFVYTFTALLPDNVVYGQFQARIDQLSDNAQLNGATVDWACIWGVGFAACVQPAPGETQEQANAKYNISIVNTANVSRQLQVRPMAQFMTSVNDTVRIVNVQPMPLIMINQSEMQQLHALMQVNNSGATAKASPELTAYMQRLATSHGITPQEVK